MYCYCFVFFTFFLFFFFLKKICEIDIFDQVWTKTHSVTKNTCVITKRQLGMPGGWSDVKNRNDADVQKALGMVLDRVNQQVNSMFRLVEQNIISLKQQVSSRHVMKMNGYRFRGGWGDRRRDRFEPFLSRFPRG